MVSTLISIYFGSARLGRAIKANCIKFQTVDPEKWSILIFEKKGLEQVYLPYFVYGFTRKIFLMLYSINRPNVVS